MICFRYFFLNQGYSFKNHAVSKLSLTSWLFWCDPCCLGHVLQAIIKSEVCRLLALNVVCGGTTQIAKFMGTTWGPPGPCRSRVSVPDGSYVGPVHLAIKVCALVGPTELEIWQRDLPRAITLKTMFSQCLCNSHVIVAVSSHFWNIYFSGTSFLIS